MLWLNNVKKTYVTGGTSVEALRGVSFGFRDNEFVAVLGPSGCGKTTLLNIIGGLDRYTDGDLVINGRSTKEYSDSDWDTYRNHSIGFVFQTYNLIPHQTVLANVELALTLSGVGRSERRKRAVDALKAVGLADQIHKKPNQMSGGQMQRVAIARALVNNPDILLADEPTGALDTETSVQVMDILREVAKDRLVIMVTHNPELAEQYATRIIRLLDGNMISDSCPVTDEEKAADDKKTERIEAKKKKKEKGTSMSFATALSLSLNNLMTKKARTILTSFAGSIGIIGIALILSMSSGFQAYINRVQEDTLSTYPIQIESESMDMSGLLMAMAGGHAGDSNSSGEAKDDGFIHSTDAIGDLYATLQSQVKNNDLKAFYQYIQTNKDRIDPYLTAIQYKYDFSLNVYNTKSEYGVTRVNPSNVPDAIEDSYSGMAMFMQTMSWDIWSEMIDNRDLLETQYEVVAGKWATEYNEVVLVVGQDNSINVLSLYTLGILDQSKLAEQMSAVAQGKPYDQEEISIKYEDIVYDDKSTEDTSDDTGWSFNLVINSDYYTKNDDNTWTDNSKDKAYVENLASNGEEIRVVGIIRPAQGAVAGSIGGSVAYTSKLTQYVADKISQSDIVKEQTENPETDIFNGMTFKGDNKLTASEMAEAFKAAAEKYDVAKKAEIMSGVSVGNMTDEEKTAVIVQRLSSMTQEEISAIAMEKFAELQGDQAAYNEFLSKYAEIVSAMMQNPESVTPEQMLPMITELIGEDILADSSLSDEEQAARFDVYISGAEESELAELYKKHCLSGSDYKTNMKILSAVDKESPKAIYLYPLDFESKDQLSTIIEEYNAGQSDENMKITYTDYIGIFISSVSTIINTISYVLIGFVSVSLVVSSIMIGVITYISVLERTKEIGILRSIGASKHDIRTVFNAETFIVGAVSGIMGVVVTLLLIIPINLIIESLSGIANIAALPVVGAISLITISIVLTVIAGLIPSGLAAKRDPVVALRSE